jgi:hypothetical protein
MGPPGLPAGGGSKRESSLLGESAKGRYAACGRNVISPGYGRCVMIASAAAISARTAPRPSKPWAYGSRTSRLANPGRAADPEVADRQADEARPVRLLLGTGPLPVPVSA